MIEIEKRPGPDWIVYVQIKGEANPVAVSVFGAATRRGAELEARRSVAPDQVIRVLSVRRLSL